MPRLSAFTPCGMLDFSSNPSHAEDFYTQLQQLYGPGVDFSLGTYAEEKLYAWAVGLARVAYELEHAGNQVYPARCFDLLHLFELDFQLTPGQSDSVPARQRALATAELLPLGAVASNVVNGLKNILGSQFLAYVTATPIGTPTYGFTQTTYPSDPTTQGIYADVRVPRRTALFVDPVTLAGSASYVSFTGIDADNAAPQFRIGEKLLVDPENSSRTEVVTIADVSTSPPAGFYATPGFTSIKATFTKLHEPGTSISTGNYPNWWSTQRFALVLTSGGVTADSEKRRKVNEFMSKVSRGVTQWAIIDSSGVFSDHATVGPLFVGSNMGSLPIGFFSVPLSM